VIYCCQEQHDKVVGAEKWNEVKTMLNVARNTKLMAIFSHVPSKKWIAVPEGWWQTSRRRAQEVYKPMSTSV